MRRDASADCKPWHLECFIRSSFGSIAHQSGLCGCFKDPPDDDGEREEGMSFRQAALMTYQWMISKTDDWEGNQTDDQV
jgi:hypothetical protein